MQSLCTKIAGDVGFFHQNTKWTSTVKVLSRVNERQESFQYLVSPWGRRAAAWLPSRRVWRLLPRPLRISKYLAQQIPCTRHSLSSCSWWSSTAQGELAYGQWHPGVILRWELPVEWKVQKVKERTYKGELEYCKLNFAFFNVQMTANFYSPTRLETCFKRVLNHAYSCLPGLFSDEAHSSA